MFVNMTCLNVVLYCFNGSTISSITCNQPSLPKRISENLKWLAKVTLFVSFKLCFFSIDRVRWNWQKQSKSGNRRRISCATSKKQRTPNRPTSYLNSTRDKIDDCFMQLKLLFCNLYDIMNSIVAWQNFCNKMEPIEKCI